MKPILLFLFLLITLPLFASSSWRNYTNNQSPIYHDNFSSNIQRNNPNFRVVSFNLKFSLQMDKLVAWWKSNPYFSTADVILLQEVVGTPNDPNDNAARFLSQKLGLNYVFIPAFVHKFNEKDFGVAILSPHPISEIEKVILPHVHFSDRTQRVAVGATIYSPSKQVRVYSVHAETLQFSKWRNDQLDEVIMASASYQDVPTLIGGDFNTSPFWQRLGLLRHARKQGWEVSSQYIKGPTFHGLLKMRLDHVFGRNVQALKAGKIGTKLSDHDAIWVDYN